MPEQAPWRFQTLIRPMFETGGGHHLLRGRVLTCRGDEVIEDGFVEIEDRTIKAVGRAADLGERASEAEVTGGTILPGLFQSHGHLAWDGIHDLAQQSMSDPPEISAYKCAGNMLINLRAGVTTFRDLGMNATNLFAKQAVAQGIFPGPRLLVCGQAIVQTGGHTYWCCRQASGPHEMRHAVREQVRGGADFIKIMACHDDAIELTAEELDAVVDESHRNGLPITAHATFDACINRVVRAGIDVVEHGGSLSEETIGLIVGRGVPIVTTFAPVFVKRRPETASAFGSPDERRQAATSLKDYIAGLVAAAKAGVAIVFGTNCGNPGVAHELIAPEMAFMVKIGVKADNYDAIRSATIAAARLSGLDRKLGTLEVGKLADIIVVDGDPTADINAIGRVRATYLEGRRMIATM